MAGSLQTYSCKEEAFRIFDYLSNQFDPLSFPPEIASRRHLINITADRDLPYFPIPFKETETAAALKAVEGTVAALLADASRSSTGSDGTRYRKSEVTVNLEKTTAFLFQAYLARVGGYGKLDKEVKGLLKDTDLLQAQSNPYRRMSANLYATKRQDEYYHIHGSLEASTTLRMIGLEPFRPDLEKHEDIVDTIESAVKKFTVEELESLNAQHRQAGVKAFTHTEFLRTPHGKTNSVLPPWSVENLENETPKVPLEDTNRVLSGIKVLELCRIIAGPTITRILGEYGAEVIKVTSPNLSDVPFFQVDGNMGKRAADIDLKTAEGRRIFEQLLAEADVVVDGYRPGAIDKLGYGAEALTELARKRGKGIVYVNENCFGYEGEWADRPGWQQIADCVTGVAWEQGRFMGLQEPLVPPFPISDYGTGCIGAITALIGLYHRATRGGSWHGKASLLHYDLLLFKVGLLPEEVQDDLRKMMGEKVLALRHANSVDQISGTTLRRMREVYPEFVGNERYLSSWYSNAYKTDVSAVLPVVEIEGLDISFKRASRPNGSDAPTWDVGEEKDYRVGV
ncbi:Acetyl-coenzyme A transferase nodX [Cladobotryum mycophilum]|uniref:Acetyl-coenzyme A transferase nodX n=1 Tax=Cladobotryum mycophilum TaxID=491253 RepID=A0ABR0SLY6_9HYPO